MTYSTRMVAADDRAIRTGLDEAKRVSAPTSRRGTSTTSRHGDDDEDLRDAYVRASALATVKPLREKIDRDADELAVRGSPSTASRSSA